LIVTCFSTWVILTYIHETARKKRVREKREKEDAGEQENY